ncbi:MAG: ThuA domain-containing protein [Isosphaeraceae bacterium]
MLIWWGHLRHEEVPLDRAEAVVKRVREGRLGFVALHSSCSSRPFRGLMGTSCEHGGWREDGHPERVTVHAPDHPITRGVSPFTIPRNDMFAEPFSVPEPETVLLISTWEQGESVRSGLTWKVEKGRVVYLPPATKPSPCCFTLRPPARCERGPVGRSTGVTRAIPPTPRTAAWVSGKRRETVTERLTGAYNDPHNRHRPTPGNSQTFGVAFRTVVASFVCGRGLHAAPAAIL